MAPDGRVTRVSYGVLNLTHRDGHAAPQPLEPGRRQRIRLQLNDIGHRFLAGHKIRVAISTAYWPIIWPAPAPVRLTLWTGHSTLSLPSRRPRPEDARVVFAEPERPTPTRRRMLKPGAVHRSICQDVASGEQRIEVLRDDGASVIEEIGVETALRKTIRYRMRPDDPTSARAEVEHDLTHRHPQGWDTRVRTHCAIACTATEFVVEADLEAFEAGIRRFSRSWTERIPRDMG